MSRKIFLLAFSLLCLSQIGFGQKSSSKGKSTLSPEEYIKKYALLAKQEMRRSGVPASITLAQGILESRAGNSELATKANNHFGIKCHNGWNGKGYYIDDDEKDECFRVYKTVEESFRDHSNFLRDRERYAKLFKLDIKDYKGWARGLQKAGYATNPAYSSLLIRIIEDRKLNKHDIANPNSKLDELITNVTRRIVLFNNLKTAIAGEFDSPETIAKKFNVSEKKILKYNNMSPGQEIPRFTKVYLQPKKSKGFNRVHVVKQGETMHSISQKEGIKLTALYKKNLMIIGEEPANGEKLTLWKKNVERPKLKTEKELKDQIKKEIKKELEEVKKEHLLETKEAQIDKPKELVDESKQVDPIEEHKPETAITDSHIEKKIEVEEPIKPSLPDKETKDAPIYHTVKTREGIYSISKLYNTSIENIKTWNNLTSSMLTLGQKIIVGYGANEDKIIPENKVVPPKPKQLKMPVYHKVAAKEGLYGISKQYNTTIDKIKAWNKLSSNTLSIGQNLIVGYSQETTPSDTEQIEAPVPESKKAPIYHKVVAKEGLYGISKLYNTTVEQIKSWNNLSSNTLSIGQNLIVGYK